MRRLLFGLSLLLIATAASAQVNDTYVIPAAGNTPGAFHTTWATQFSVFNPQSYTLRVSITYLPTLGGQGLEEKVDVPANALALSDNILADLFKIQNGTGALLVATFPEDNPNIPDTVIARAFLVTTNTFNNSPAGTFGQTIPGVWAGLQDYNTQPSISAIAHGIRNGGKWRTNIGAVNLGRAISPAAKLRINVYNADGQTIAKNIPLDLPPMGHIQESLDSAFGGGHLDINGGTLEFFVDDPLASDANNSAVVFPYVSVIDQDSGDPQYQSPVLLATANVLFKSGMTSIDPTSIGTKINNDFARRIRDTAAHLGIGHLQTR